MQASISLRLDRELPPSLTSSSVLKENVAIDLFDAERLELVLNGLEALGAIIVSAISVDLPFNLVECWREPSPDWVAGVVGSDNHEWLADETYTWPFDWSKQRVPPGQPLHVYWTPKGKFSELGYQFGARASFRKAVDEMPESFEYSTGAVIRKGKVLESWSRIEPLREIRLLSPDSLGNLSTTFHRHPFRSNLLWMGDRLDDDFGFVWDALPHGWYEQERCALVPVHTAAKLSRKFPGDFVCIPVFDRKSPTAVRAIEAFQAIRERLPMQGWV